MLKPETYIRKYLSRQDRLKTKKSEHFFLLNFMQTHAAKLSNKGKVAIPKEIIDRHRWKGGQELEVIDTEDGILLKSAPTFKPTRLDEVVGILQYSGKPVSLEEMQEALFGKAHWSGNRWFQWTLT